MTDSAQVSDEQLIAEWQPQGAGRVTAEQLLVDWAPRDIGRLMTEQLLVEWQPSAAARVTGVQLLVEWGYRAEAHLTGAGSLTATVWATQAAAAALGGSGRLSARMSGQVVLRAASSNLSFGGLFDRLLAEGTETAATIAIALAASQTNSGYAFTPADFPGVQGSTGDYTVKVNVTTANTRIFISVRIARLNAAGTIQASSAFSAEQTASAGVKTFSFSGLDLGTWQAGDRLMVQYQFRNSRNNTQSTAIQAGTANAAVTTPWSMPQGKASLKGAGGLTATATVIGPTDIAAFSAAETTVSGTAETTHSGTASYAPDGSLDWDMQVVL